MVRGERPTWDVCGFTVLCCDGRGEPMEYRIRCYPGGQGRVDIDGVSLPIPPTMTAMQYFEMVFEQRFGITKRRSAGD